MHRRKIQIDWTRWLAVVTAGAFWVLAGGSQRWVEAADEVAPDTRLATYETSTGETYYALSLVPQVKTPAVRPCDVIVLFDTSASQTGAYRTESMEVLRALLERLHEKTRVRLFAIDLVPLALNDELVSAGHPQTLKALQLLARRIPLGATDLAVGLREVLASFPPTAQRPRRVVYIGDGISRANILQVDEFRELVQRLVEQRVSISSFGTGPQLDFQMLAALANHTGGMVFVDSAEVSPQQAGTALAMAAQQGVLWPVSTRLPKSLQEVFPERVPPLRTDRDSILIGKFERGDRFSMQMTAELDGQRTTLTWELMPEMSNESFNFLPQLVREARASRGWALPTVGSAGLREVARLISSSAQELIRYAQQALKNEDLAGANTVADAVLRRDPGNPQAEAIKRVIRKKKRAAAPARKPKKKNPLRARTPARAP